MKVLVTGATGFIGSQIVLRLAGSSEDHRIVAVARNTDRRAISHPNVEYRQADITEADGLSSLAPGREFDAVVHAAGLAHQFGDTPDGDFRKVNVAGTANIADLAARTGARHFVLVGSTAVYGIREGPVDEDSECRPETPYARSKLEAERVCREICERAGIPLTIFRLAPVLGEKGVGNVPRLIEAIDRGRFVFVGSGENRKALISVEDIARACLALLEQKRNGTEIFNLAAEPISTNKLVDTISTALAKSPLRMRIPAALPRLVLGLNARTIRLRSLDRISQTLEKWLCEDLFMAEKIEKAYGFRPAVSVPNAVREQCRWYLEQKKSRASHQVTGSAASPED